MNFVKFVKLSCETYITFTTTVLPGGSVRVRAKLTVEFTQPKMVVCGRRFGTTYLSHRQE
jgi:hypothetical protein